MVPDDELDDLPQPRFRRYFLLPVAVVLAGVAIFAASRPSAESDSKPTTLPSFELPRLDTGSLSSDELDGKPVVLNVWASWCGPCREEAPAFERLWKRYRDEGLVILGVNTQDSEEAARAFVNEFEITYPIVRDEDQELVSELERFSGISDAWPQTFFVGRDGRFIEAEAGGALTTEEGTVLGAISEEELRTKIEALLATSASPTP